MILAAGRRRHRRRLKVTWGLAAARGDYDKLAAVHFIGGGSRVGGEGQRCLPKQLTGRFVKGAELLVEVSRSDEQQPARRNNGTSVILRAVFFWPFAASSGYSPKGIFQTYSPVFRLMAFRVPHGGATAGYPSGSRNL